jgi:hypothetical protein
MSYEISNFGTNQVPERSIRSLSAYTRVDYSELGVKTVLVF